ncbi:MAG: beta-propeller domain-containing protein [Oscillospiraceae bacterium]|nr:beta-propeller domain-containing protein [Oscillospiraceae bacterium]
MGKSNFPVLVPYVPAPPPEPEKQPITNVTEEDEEEDEEVYYEDDFFEEDFFIEDEDEVDFDFDSDDSWDDYEDDSQTESTDSSSDSNTAAIDDFSTTNVQVEEVEEGDIVKTDGKYIYTSSTRTASVNVVETSNGRMRRIAHIEKENARPIELLLYKGRLIVFWEKSEYNIYGKNNDYLRKYEHQMVIEVYNTKGDFKKPMSVYSQMGKYYSSRMLNNNIYLVTEFSPYLTSNEFDEADARGYIPSFAVNEKNRFIPSSSIVIPPELNSTSKYTLISGLDVNNQELLVSAKATLGQADVVYSSRRNMYIADLSWRGGQSTDISKFSLNNGRVGYVGSCRVLGHVKNQFGLDEHNGALRVFSEYVDWDLETILTTFDSELNWLASIRGIGAGENLKSARFYGDVGYAVTFMATDPLYSFDLSEPANPIMLGELKIPGFSRYMHRWDDGLLLGIGVDADENRGGLRTGLKLSMFDVSDNEEMSERHVHIIPAVRSGTWGRHIFTPAEVEHRSLIISPQRNIIAFPYVNDNVYKYALFSYDKEVGFKLISEIIDDEPNFEFTQMSFNDAWIYGYFDENNDWIWEEDWWYDYEDWWHEDRDNRWERQQYDNYIGFRRGLYIGNYIYAISDKKIVSARLSDLEIIQVLLLIDEQLTDN